MILIHLQNQFKLWIILVSHQIHRIQRDVLDFFVTKKHRAFVLEILQTHVISHLPASEKGDSTENCDPNSLLSNGTKTALECKPNAEKPLTEAPTESTACSSESVEESEVCEIPEQIEFTVVFNKVKHDITFAYDASVLELKAHLERICGVPLSAQKLLIKGMARDDMTLRKAGVVKGGKVMLVGSKMDDILAVKSVPKVLILIILLCMTCIFFFLQLLLFRLH